MSKQKKTEEYKKDEYVSLTFLGMKINCNNPGIKTIWILIILLAFFIIFGFFLKDLLSPNSNIFKIVLFK
jgi:hypothetical protein